MGAATQLEKIDMLDFADLVAINKFDKRGALDARARCQRNNTCRNNNLVGRTSRMICRYTEPSPRSLTTQG